MNAKHKIWSIIISLALILGTSPGSYAKVEETESTNKFPRIEQPFPLKLLVTLVGLALIGTEMWWFLFSKTKAQKATSHQGIQEVKITVDGGYTPDRIVVQVGQTVRLNFLRKDPSSCLEKVLLPDFDIALDLPLNQMASAEFTPTQPGEYRFTCGMKTFHGIVEVKP